MTFIREGWRELQRKIHRRHVRALLEAKRKKLAEAEIRLGSSCADQVSSVPELQPAAKAVERLREKEQEQQKLLDDTQEQLDAGKASLDQAKKWHQEDLHRLQDDRKPAVEERNICKNKLRAFEAEITECNRKLKALKTGRSQKALSKRPPTLTSTEGNPPATMAETPGNLEADADNERDALKKELEQAESRIKPLQRELEQYEQRLRKSDERIAKSQDDWKQEEKKHHHALHAWELRVKTLKEELFKLERQRAEPFREIGQYVVLHSDLAGSRQKELEQTRQLQSEVAAVERENDRLAQESATINHQDIRKFYFVIVSLAAIIGIAVLLASRPEAPSVYLPASTTAIISVNINDVTQAGELVRSKMSEERMAALSNQLITVSKAAADFGLPTKRGSLTLAIPSQPVSSAPADSIRSLLPWRVLHYPEISGRETLEWLSKVQGKRTSISGIAIIQQDNKAIAAVGPGMYAFGDQQSVELLVESRLGKSADLRIDTPPLNVFSRMSNRFDFRVATTSDSPLAKRWETVLGSRWIENDRALAMGIAFDESDARIRFIVNCQHADQAKALAKKMQTNPATFFTVENHEDPIGFVNLKIKRHDRQLEIQFDTNAPEALELIEKLTTFEAMHQTTEGKSDGQSSQSFRAITPPPVVATLSPYS